MRNDVITVRKPATTGKEINGADCARCTCAGPFVFLLGGGVLPPQAEAIVRIARKRAIAKNGMAQAITYFAGQIIFLSVSSTPSMSVRGTPWTAYAQVSHGQLK